MYTVKNGLAVKYVCLYLLNAEFARLELDILYLFNGIITSESLLPCSHM